MKYFKTDGIRMVSQNLIFSLLPLKLGRILGETSKKVCVGYDTRISSSEIFDLLVTGLVTRGCDVITLGICPSSMVGYVTKKENCDYGVMITASHNPYFYNGLKVFSSSGEKINDLEEREIEELLNRNLLFSKGNKLGKVYSSKYKEEYFTYLRNLIDFSLSGRILVDAGNGVISECFNKVFKNKIEYDMINSNPNGTNINENCGSEHIENLINNLTDEYDYGVAFDGDGDRLVIVNKDKKIISGEDLLYLFSKEYNYSSIVTTKMSNLGLEEKLNTENKKVIYTEVGDRRIYKKMKEENIYLGGESSGHISFLNSLVINDAMFTLIKFLSLKNKEETYNKYFSKTINISTENKSFNKSSIKNIEENINDLIKDKGRVFLRKSGTENVIRINIQAKDENDFLEIEKRVNKTIQDDVL